MLARWKVVCSQVGQALCGEHHNQHNKVGFWLSAVVMIGVEEGIRCSLGGVLIVGWNDVGG